jgi:hypothetical protein
MDRDNPTWGEERIADELLLKLGIRVSPRDKLYLIDSESGKAREIFPAAPHSIPPAGARLSPDNRMIYFSVAIAEGDVWLADLAVR